MAFEFHPDRSEAVSIADRPLLDREAGLFEGVGKAALMAAPRAALKSAESLHMLATGIEPGLSEAERDAQFRFIEETYGPAVKSVTPKSNEVGTAGQVVGGFLEAMSYLTTRGGVRPLVAIEPLNVSREFVGQGVDPQTALRAQAALATANVLGFQIPFLGKSITQRVMTGIGTNVALGAGTDAWVGSVLDSGGYGELAKLYDPMNAQSRLLDALLGGAFGGLSHAMRDTGARLPPEVADAAMALNLERQSGRNGLIGRPMTPEAWNAHNEAMRAALDSVQLGGTADVAAIIERQKFAADQAIEQERGRIRQEADLVLARTIGKYDIETIPVGDSLGGDLRGVETRFRQYLAGNFDDAAKRYRENPETDGGRIINTDEARKLSKDYSATRESAALLSSAVHEPASWFVKEFYARQVQQPAPAGRDNVVVFTGGGSGAGKTRAIGKAHGGILGRAQLVYDQNGNRFDSAREKIAVARAAGKQVQFLYVLRDPIETLVDGVLKRAMNPQNNGRTVPIRQHVLTHKGSIETLPKLVEHFKDDPAVEFHIIDNRGAEPKIGALKDLGEIDLTNLEARLYAALKAEHQGGRISDAVYFGTKGVGPEASVRAAARGNAKPGQKTKASRGEPPADGEAAKVTGGIARVPDVESIDAALAASRVSAVGDSGTAITERGTRVGFRWAVIEAANLRTSHTDTLARAENFDAGIQPRERDRVSSETQIARIEGNLEFSRVSDSPTVADGAPFLGPDDQVESGNARSIAIRRAYASGRALRYKQDVIEGAAARGIDPQTVAQMERPVLVRQRTTPVPDRAAFAIEANEQAQARLSMAEQARIDASRLTNLDSLVINEDGSINMRESMPFVRGFLGQVVGGTDLNAMMRPDGTLSTEGVLRVRNAVFSKAYGDAQLVSMLVEGTDENVRTMLAGLMRASASMADVREGARTGYYHPLDISDDVAAAARMFADIKSQGMTVKDYLATEALFDPITPLQAELLLGLELMGRSAKRIGDFLNGYADRVGQAGNPSQASMLAGEGTPTREAMVREALREAMPAPAEVPRETTVKTLPKSTPDVEAAARMAADVVARNPDLLVPDAEGNVRTAADLMADADKRVAEADAEASLFDEIGREAHAAEERAGYQAESTRAAYNPAQGQLDLEGADTSAVVVDRLAKSSNLLAQSIATDFRSADSAAIIGQTINSAADLGVIGQVFRHPGFETLRYVFVKNGRVVHSTGVTQRNPGSVVAFADKGDGVSSFESLAETITRVGADKFYMLHNHPSGNPNPSRADLLMTESVELDLAGRGLGGVFDGHVVVNHKQYSIIPRGAGGSFETVQTKPIDNVPLRQAAGDPRVLPALGSSVFSPADLTKIAKNLETVRKGGMFLLVGRAADGKVASILEYPIEWLNRHPTRLKAEARRFARNSGGTEVFVVGLDHSNPTIRAGLEANVLLDAVAWDGTPSSNFGYGGSKGLFPDRKALTVREPGPDDRTPVQSSIYKFEPPLPAVKKLRPEVVKEIKQEILMTLRYLQSRKLRGDPKLQAMSTEQLKVEAARMAADEWARQAAQAKRFAAMRVAKAEELSGRQDAHPEGTFRGLVSMMVKDKADKGGAFSFEARELGIRAYALSKLLPALQSTNPRLFGLIEDNEGWRKLFREIYGEDTGEAAYRDGAKAWGESAELLRGMANNAGYSISRLANYRLPQHHDRKLVGEAGVDQWVADVLPKLDREFYVDENGRLLTDDEMVGVLKVMWNDIQMSGFSAAEPGAFKPTENRAGRYQEHRTLHFLKADNYADYLAKYGGASISSVMVGHVRRLARDVALVETFGPNPEGMYNLLRERAELAGDKDTLNFADNVFREISGKTNPGQVPTWAEWSQGARNLQVSSKLGSAVLSSLTDQATLHITAQMNNLPAMQVVQNQLKAMNPADRAERERAAIAGLGLESMLADLNRWGEEGLGIGVTAKLANFTMRASGLEALTNANRRAFSVTMMGGIGKMVRDMDFAKLAESDGRILSSKGVTETDWKVWKAAKPEAWGDVSTMLTPNAIEALTAADLAKIAPDMPAEAVRREAIVKLLGVILEEQDIAVLTSGYRERAILKQGTDRGSVPGELLRHFALFKSYPTALIAKHWTRALSQPTAAGKWGYAVALFGASTLLGAVAMQAKDIVKGRDPRSMLSPKAWLAAMAQGGGLGIYGDFLFSDQSRYGTDLISTLAGPTAGTVDEIYKATIGNIHQALRGEEANAGADILKVLKSNTPAINLWYTKTAVDRLILNDLQEYLNPGYLSRQSAKVRRDTGSESWWEPGELRPARLPDFRAMLEPQ